MNDQAIVTVPKAGEILRKGFADSEIEVRGDTAGVAMAAQARASVEAAYVMAMRRPRDLDQVRVKLLKATARRRFAEAARWQRPVGREKNKKTGRWEEKIGEGLSIRFAEEAARNMGNLSMDSYVVYEDTRKKVCKFVVIDLETNTQWARTRTIEKTKEKAKLWDGDVALSSRINSTGEVVYIVEATADDVTKRESAEASKAWRDGILKNLPADIKEECMETIQATIVNEATVDPEGEKKRICDSFASIGIEPFHLKAYLGHGLETVSPAELVKLRGIFVSIKEGTTNWADVVAAKDDADEANAAEAATAAKAKAAAAPPPSQAPPTATRDAAGNPVEQPAAPPPAPTPAPPKGQRNLSDVAAQSKLKREGQGKPPGQNEMIELPKPDDRAPGSDDDKP
jgi:hypothetical protein